MLLSVAMILLFVQPPGELGGGPEPAPTAVTWELDFKYVNPPRRIEMGGTTYWYLVYTATNRSSATQRFFPRSQLVTEELRVIETDMGINAAVFDAIRQRHQKTHPYLVSPTKAVGEIRIGDDNAIESVAIWRNVDLSVNEFKIVIGGLSGETRLIRNPAFDPSRPETPPSAAAEPPGTEQNPRFFTLRKTLELSYRLAGSENTRIAAEPVLERARWIMR